MMFRILASLGTLTLLATPSAFAQDIGDGGCVYDRQIYPEGAELCQDGTLKRCQEGSWDDIGICKAEPARAPNPEGGDEVESED
jgi:hypothetical protein